VLRKKGMARNDESRKTGQKGGGKEGPKRVVNLKSKNRNGTRQEHQQLRQREVEVKGTNPGGIRGKAESVNRVNRNRRINLISEGARIPGRLVWRIRTFKTEEGKRYFKNALLG